MYGVEKKQNRNIFHFDCAWFKVKKTLIKPYLRLFFQIKEISIKYKFQSTGGISALAMHLHTSYLTQNCLLALRNLSDAAIKVVDFNTKYS